MKTRKIPKGWHRLRNGTLLREGDRFAWMTGWCAVDVCKDGNWSCDPYVYIRRDRDSRNLRKALSPHRCGERTAMPTDTPRTDSCPTPKHGYVPAEFARTLERENNRLRKAGLNLIAAIPHEGEGTQRSMAADEMRRAIES